MTLSFSVHGVQQHHSGPNELHHLPPRRKHRNSAILAALCRWSTHRKHSGASSPVNFKQGFRKSEVSARKLAAELWRLRFMEISGDGGVSFGDGLFRPSVSEGLCSQLESSMPCLKRSKEDATKWSPALNDASSEFSKIHRRKLLEDRILACNGDTIVTTLLEELVRAKSSSNKLKAAKKSSEKKIQHFLLNLEEKKASWKRRERQKTEAMLNDSKDKLERERKSKDNMELLNSKLAHELAEANQSAKQFMTNYEKEKKERELKEEMCNELSMQIGEYKVKLEGLLRDSMQIRMEVEEERKMTQIAEIWREERVQMKLFDAKLILEEKLNQMVQLIANMQMFLRSKGVELGTKELEDSQLIKQAVESVNIQHIVELSYDFSKSHNTFPIYEELRKDNAIESLDEEGLNKNSILHPSKWKVSSASKQMRLYPNGGTIIMSSPESSQHRRPGDRLYKQKECNQRLSTSSIQSGGTASSSSSLCKGSSSFRHSRLLGKGKSTDNMNPHITREIKGCMEWPQGNTKKNSKVIPLEERVKSQKSQLQHILKPKAY